MAWEPIEVSEEMVRDFAQRAAALCDELDDRGKLMWRTIIDRAGGESHPEQSDSEPAIGRYGEPGANENGASGKRESTLEHFSRLLLTVWEPGTTIAPLNSSSMPNQDRETGD